jgi:hypothetical protein
MALRLSATSCGIEAIPSAIASGRAMIATVRPAVRSPRTFGAV